MASAENEDGSYPAMNKMLRLCDIPWATKEMVDAAAAGKEMPVEVVTVEDDEDGDDVQVLSSSSAVSGFHGQRAAVADTSLGFDHGNARVFGMGDMSANAGYPSQVMMSLPSELARFQSFGGGYFQDPSMGGFHHG
jgi:hypothetical protein